MKVLITGAGGQVGRALLNSVPPSMTAVGLAHADLDVTDEQGVAQRVKLERPDVIINAAAYTAVDKAEQEPEAAQRGNTLAPRNLASAASAVGARFLHISTDYVFDGCAFRPYSPEAATNPQSVYGKTKCAGEEIVRQTLPERSVIVRTAWVYSAHGNNFVRTMLRVMSTRGAARVVADQVGTPTEAGSLARVLWSVAAKPEVNGTHHWTDAGVASWYDFAVAIAEESALIGLLPESIRTEPIATEDYPTPAKRPAYSVLDKRSLLAATGVEPRHWRCRLREVLREIRNA
jgi:dTDP-4-dehydrorhamnose reductase